MKYPPGLTVGYITSGEWTSRLIEWRSAGGPSHATTLVAPGWVIDARFKGGVQRRPVSYLAGDVRWLRVPATAAQVSAVLKALESQIGRPYDWRSIVDFAIPQLFKRSWNDDRAWICSALQVWAEECGLILPKVSTKVRRLDPNDAMLMNEARGALELPEPMFD